MKRYYWLALAIVAALGLLAACGGDDEDERLSGEEFGAQMTQINERVDGAFDDVFRAIGNAKENELVPEEARQAALRAAETERAAADELDELTPPEDAEETVDELVSVAREQADTIEAAANEEGVTVRELADAFEQQNPEALLDELGRLGYIGDEQESGGE